MPDARLAPLVLPEDERHTLENWASRRSTAQRLALRARIMLASAEGRSNLAVAARLGVNRSTVTKWRARFLAARLDGLGDEPRPGVPRSITDAQVEEVVIRTLEEAPLLICPGAASRRGLPYGVQLGFMGVQLGGKIIGAGLRGCGCGAGTGEQQRKAVTVLP